MMVELASRFLKVKILSKGAEICSVTDQDGAERIWQADPNVWARHAPVLFPIVGKLKDDRYLHEGKEYSLPQHGFARDMDFNLVEADASSCSFELRSNEETLSKYPFAFQLRIGYTLIEQRLNVKYTVVNEGNKEMYFSIGAHPGFTLPMGERGSWEDHYLETGNDELSFTLLKNGLLSKEHKGYRNADRILQLASNTFDHDALILEHGQISTITLRSNTSAKRIVLQCKGWPYFGIWSKKGCQQFICLEPWYGITDSTDATGELKQKKGIIRLNPNTSFDSEFSLEFL